MNDSVRFNKREIILPFYRVGISEPSLMDFWKAFKDFKTVR